ncbi:MAG: YHS domain-containing (seleno)protein [Luteolibacter sp.]
MKTLPSLMVVASMALAPFTAHAAEMMKDKKGKAEMGAEKMAMDKMAMVELGGYCPVCYIAAGKAVKGSAEFTAVHEEKTYHFVSKETMEMFQKNPSKYLPAYDGLCAYGMSLGKKFPSDPTVFKVVEGKVYLNKNAEVGKLFGEGTMAQIAKADAEWKKMGMEMKK